MMLLAESLGSRSILNGPVVQRRQEFCFSNKDAGRRPEFGVAVTVPANKQSFPAPLSFSTPAGASER